MNNGPYIRREGPLYGWENYPPAWKKEKNAVIDTWKTENYTANTAMIRLLKKHFSR